MVTTDVQPAVGGKHTGGHGIGISICVPSPTFNQRCDDAFVFASNDSSGTVILSHLQGKLPTEKSRFPRTGAQGSCWKGFLLFQERPKACMGSMIGSGRTSNQIKGFQADDKVT